MKTTIPDTIEGMQQLMRDPKRMARLIEDGGLPELVQTYARSTAASDVREILDGQLREYGVNRPPLGGPGDGAARNAAYSRLAPGVKMDDLGFANLGEVVGLLDVRRPDPRREDAYRVMDAYSSGEPAAGGFLIPETMRSEVMQLALEQSIVRQRATVITMGTPTQLMPFVDSTSNVGSVFGGMIFSWTPEGGTLAATQAKFGRLKLEANKLTGFAVVPNELWNDAPALASWLMEAMPKGIAFSEDVAFLTGNGAGQPLGILESPALVVVEKEGDQPADTIIVENVLKMYSRMLPSSLSNAIWIGNQSCFKELMTLSISVGVGGAPVFLVDIHASPVPTMLGRPLVITEKVPTLGDQGDLCFLDLSYYLIGDRQAVSVDTSEHVYFASDETALRVIERVDGRPWVQSAFTPLNGADVSPFVALEARA